MLSYDFRRIMSARGIDRPYSFLKKNGFSHNFANRIASNDINMLSLRHMEKLCQLFHCSPLDLLEWKPNSAKEDTPDHPLAAFKKQDKVADILPMLKQLPVERINEVVKMLEEMKGRK